METYSYRCSNKHEVDHGISLSSGGGSEGSLVCPECKAPIIFSVAKESPTTTFRISEGMCDAKGWHEAQGVFIGSTGMNLSIFDVPERITQTSGPDAEMEYRFGYHHDYKDTDLWRFSMRDAEVALLKYDWQVSDPKPGIVGKLLGREEPSISFWRQPMETSLSIVKGKNKAACITACKTIMLAADKFTTRVNANLCGWLIDLL